MAFALATLLLWMMFSPSASPPPGQRKAIIRIAVSPSGAWIAAANAAGQIMIWPGKGSAQPLRFRNRAGTVNDLCFSNDDRWLAIAGRCLTLQSISGRPETRILKDDHRNYGSVKFSSDGSRILTIDGSGAIEILSAATGATTARSCCSTIAGGVAFGPGDTQVFSAGHLPRVWDARSLGLVRRLTQDRQFMNLGPVALRNSDILMGSQDGRIHIWDRSTYARKESSPGSLDWVDTIAIQPATGVIAYSGFGKPLRLWNPDTRSSSVYSHIRPSSTIEFTPASGQLAVGLDNGTVTIWDLAHGRLTNILQFPSAP